MMILFFRENFFGLTLTIAMFILTGIILFLLRYVMTRAFLLQRSAEKSRDLVTKLFEKLPDAVLVLSDAQISMT